MLQIVHVAMKCCRIWKPFPESLDLNWNLSNDLAMHNNYASNLNIKEVYVKDCLVHSISTKSKSLNSSNLFIFSPSYQAGKSLLDCFVLVSFLLCFFLVWVTVLEFYALYVSGSPPNSDDCHEVIKYMTFPWNKGTLPAIQYFAIISI